VRQSIDDGPLGQALERLDTGLHQMRGRNPRRELSGGAAILDGGGGERVVGDCAAGEHVVPYELDGAIAMDVTGGGRNLDELGCFGLLLCHKLLADLEVADVYRGDGFDARVELFPEVFAEGECNVGGDGLRAISV